MEAPEVSVAWQGSFPQSTRERLPCCCGSAVERDAGNAGSIIYVPVEHQSRMTTMESLGHFNKPSRSDRMQGR